MRTRSAREEDAEAIVDLLMRGFGTYGDWAPGWVAPGALRSEQLRAWREGLATPESCTRVAESEGAFAAVVRFGPARVDRASGAAIPGLAHLGALFVDPDHWGRGLGGEMLRAAIGEMRARGYERARLLVPEGNRRARELYERHGFEPLGPWPERLFGLALVEHRLVLGEEGAAPGHR